MVKMGSRYWFQILKLNNLNFIGFQISPLMAQIGHLTKPKRIKPIPNRPHIMDCMSADLGSPKPDQNQVAGPTATEHGVQTPKIRCIQIVQILLLLDNIKRFFPFYLSENVTMIIGISHAKISLRKYDLFPSSTRILKFRDFIV